MHMWLLLTKADLMPAPQGSVLSPLGWGHCLAQAGGSLASSRTALAGPRALPWSWQDTLTTDSTPGVSISLGNAAVPPGSCPLGHEGVSKPL